MDAGEFEGLLRAGGLGAWVDRLLENSVDTPEVLLLLTDSDFRELQVPLGIRVRLRQVAEAAVAAPRFPAAAPGDAATERRQLTILFSDLVGSTALSAAMDPEDLADLLRLYHERCIEIVSRFDGTVAQLLGDGMLAYFGYPLAHEDDASRAVMAGLEVISATAEAAPPTPSSVEVRVGIATGLTVVGDPLRSPRGNPSDIMGVGETPNLAARVQSMADPGSVVITESTARLLGGAFDLQDLGARPLKGIPEAVRLYQVGGRRRAESRFAARRSLVGQRLAGRSEEVKRCRRHWQHARRGSVVSVLVSGEPGIGKSRLSYETLQLTDGGEIVMQCSSFHVTSPFFPVLEYVWRDLATDSRHPPEDLRAAVDGLLARLGLGEPESSQILAELLGLTDTADEPHPDGSSAVERRAQTLRLLEAYVLGHAGEPGVVLFEDVQWADPSTLELIGRLLDLTDRSLLVVLTARPEFAAPWSVTDRVELGPLEPSAARALVAEVTAGLAPGSAEVDVDAILSRSSGVPLFLEELTRSVVQPPGAVRQGVDAVPTTLQDGLTARLDGLGAAKQVAQVAASFGREFQREPLGAVMRSDHDELERLLAQLVEADIIETAVPGAYVFRHALIRDAAYGTMLHSTRRRVHGQIADALASSPAGSTLAPTELIARHLELGGRTEQATIAWLDAAEQASRRSALAEAVADCDAGLAALGRSNPELELRLHLLRGGMLRLMRGFGSDEALGAYEAASALCRDLGEDAGLITALTGLYSYYHQHDYRRARALASEMLTVAKRRHVPSDELIANRAVGMVLFHMGEPQTARAHLERSLDLYDHERDAAAAYLYGTDHAETTASFLALATWASGDPVAAIQRSDWAVAHARSLEHAPSVAQALAYRVMLAALLGQSALADLAADLAVVADGADLGLFSTVARFFSAVADGRGGRPADAAPAMAEAEEAWQRSGSDGYRPLRSVLRAEVAASLGRIDQGLDLVAEGLAQAEVSGEYWSDAELHRARGDLLAGVGQAELAATAYQEGVAVARAQANPCLEVRAATSLLALAPRPDTVASLREALSRMRSDGLDARRAHAALGRASESVLGD